MCTEEGWKLKIKGQRKTKELKVLRETSLLLYKCRTQKQKVINDQTKNPRKKARKKVENYISNEKDPMLIFQPTVRKRTIVAVIIKWNYSTTDYNVSFVWLQVKSNWKRTKSMFNNEDVCPAKRARIQNDTAANIRTNSSENQIWVNQRKYKIKLRKNLMHREYKVLISIERVERRRR